MAPQDVIHDASIHGLVLSNDVSGLETLLKIHPQTDLNELDEFVSGKAKLPHLTSLELSVL